VDAEFVLILPLQSRATHIVADAGAAPVDGSVQHRHDSAAQAAGFRGAGVATELRRRQAGLEERFVSVDVTHAGDLALIEQHGLQAAAGSTQAFPPTARRQVPWLRPKSGLLEEPFQLLRFREQGGTAEATDV